MIELFEVDDIVSTKKGKNNPKRKADARALRTITDYMKQFPKGTFHEDVKIIAHGDTRYEPVSNSYTPDSSISHHNYRAYLTILLGLFKSILTVFLLIEKTFQIRN